ncbi:MAG: polyprenyl synthetase family protein [Actinobacteria bacterium]|nr:polyprenyl synthetase family protein [Actinomycetota bacterium]
MIDRALSADVLADVDAVIDACFRDVAERIGTVEGFDEVWDQARQGAEGGKLLRPRLVLSAHRAFADEPSDDAIRAAAAVELLHLAFLLHDDVIDRDLIRRGGPNLIALRRDAALAVGADEDAALRYGASCAILAGDLLLSAAHRLIAGLEVPSAPRGALLQVLADAVDAAAVGEHADILLGLRGDADEAAILRTMEHKTARYSFGAPLRIGALLGGAPPAAVEALGFIGATIGIAFQARDDVLGVFGDPRQTGKSALSDLREGKMTLLIAHARTAPAWNAVSALFGDTDLDDDGATALRDAIRRSGALDRTEAVISSLVVEARASMLLAALPARLVDDLERVIAGATERSR